MFRRRLVVVAALALVLLATAGTAAAAPLSVKAVTSTLRGQRVFVQPAVAPKPDVAVLRTLARQPENRGWRFVILDVPLRGTSTAQQSADAIVEEFGTTKVTIVVVVKKLGAASSQYAADQVTAAVTTANQAGAGTDPVALSQAFASALVQPGQPPSTTGGGGGTNTTGGGTGNQAGGAGADDAGGDDGRPWWQWVLAAAVAAAVLLLVLTRLRSRSRDRRKRRRGGSIGTSRDFHLDRLERLARRHAELVRPIAERGAEDPEMQQHYETAGGKLVALRRSIPQLASPRELRTAASELDEIEWHVESAESLVAGRPTPPKPLRDRPALCFFTHLHGLATEEIDLVRPDGTITAVRVCPANARALERGEMPEVSTVHVGGREIPWPAAPTWYGAPGWTLDDLPGTEYQGREIWGRDMPRREEPLPAGEGEPGAEGDAVGEDDEGLPPGVRVPDEEHPEGATVDDAVALGPGLLDPDDLAAIESQEQPAPDGVADAPGASEQAPDDAADEVPPTDASSAPADEATSDGEEAPAPEGRRRRRRSERANDETVAFDPFGGSEDLAPWERDEDAPPRGG